MPDPRPESMAVARVVAGAAVHHRGETVADAQGHRHLRLAGGDLLRQALGAVIPGTRPPEQVVGVPPADRADDRAAAGGGQIVQVVAESDVVRGDLNGLLLPPAAGTGCRWGLGRRSAGNGR